MNKAHRAKIFLGELTLGDLWEMGMLEGMMSLGENQRITAGLSGDSIEFCGPNGIPNKYPSVAKVKINTSHLPNCAFDFEGLTLIVSRNMDSFLEEKHEENP